MEQFQNIIHKKANERQQDVHCSMGLYQIIIDNYIAIFKIDRNAKTEYGYYITVYTLNGKGKAPSLYKIYPDLFAEELEQEQYLAFRNALLAKAKK